MKLSLIIEAVNKASRPVDDASKSNDRLNRSARQAAGGLGAADRSMGRADRSARGLDRSATRMGRGILSATRRGVSGLLALERRMTLTRGQMNRLAFASGKMLGGALRGGLLAGSAIAGAGIAAALVKVVSAGMENEKFRTQLAGLEGSRAAGSRAFDWVTEFSAKTPYEMATVMESFIALKAYGIDPTDGSLRTLGDTAAGMNAPLMQAVEMMADAMTGEFERLKAFGVRAEKQGDKVTFRYRQNGKDMTRTAQNNGAAIQQAMLSIFDARFAGGMESMAKTTEGKWSNMMDRMNSTAARVWEGGMGTAVNEQLDRFNGWIDGLEKDGSLKKWSTETGQAIGGFIRQVGAFDWQGFGQDVKDVAGAIRDFTGALGELQRIGNGIADFLNNLQRGFGAFDAMRENGVSIGPGGSIRYAQPPARSGTVSVPIRDGRTQPRGDYVPKGQPQPRRVSPGPKASLRVDIIAPKGMTAVPGKLAASGIDVQVNTGRAMVGSA